MHGTDALPLVGSTVDVRGSDSLEHWRSIFGGIWGPVELTEIGSGKIAGSLYSRHVGNLTFNRLHFGNQLFECVKGNTACRDEPFYSMTFPHAGAADCFVGDCHKHLVPNHCYLINVDLSAKLRVEKDYSTFNIQIPKSAMDHRLGRRIKIAPCGIVQSDAIYHMMQWLIGELVSSAECLDKNTSGFLANQLLDTMAFFLAAGSEMSDDTLAVQTVRARVLAFLDSSFHDASLDPQTIAQACGISRSYLYKIFAEGPSVMEHLRRRRLEAARGLIELRRNDLPITSVAMACGFSSSSEFSRLFKKEFGIKPSHY